MSSGSTLIEGTSPKETTKESETPRLDDKSPTTDSFTNHLNEESNPGNDSVDPSSGTATKNSTDPQKAVATPQVDDVMLVIRVVPPKSEPFEVIASASEMAQEVYMMVSEHETTLHRTCFSLHMTSPANMLIAARTAAAVAASASASPSTPGPANSEQSVNALTSSAGASALAPTSWVIDQFQELKAIDPIKMYLEKYYTPALLAQAEAIVAAAQGMTDSSSEKEKEGKEKENEGKEIPALTKKAEDEDAGEEAKERGEKREKREGKKKAAASGKKGTGNKKQRHLRGHAKWLSDRNFLSEGGGESPLTKEEEIPGSPPPLVFTLVEEPYTTRDVKVQLRHIREILRGPTGYLLDSYSASDGASVSFVTALIEEKKPTAVRDRAERERLNEHLPPEYLLPGYCLAPGRDSPANTTNGSSNEKTPIQYLRRTLPLNPLHQISPSDLKGVKCVTSLDVSSWSPPPAWRKVRGDLLYIRIVTLESLTLHVTACARGFYVNGSTDTHFNPQPATDSYLSHSLVDLLRQVSPSFKRNWESLVRRRVSRHPLETFPNPLPNYASIWLAPNTLFTQHVPDTLRLVDALGPRAMAEPQTHLMTALAGQPRDWNEELQQCRSLPQSSLQQRLVRHRALFKTCSDFIWSATRAALGVIDGQLQPVNPGEPLRAHMFLYNNMFLSLGFDVKDHYKVLGGDNAAFIAPKLDQAGIRAYDEALSALAIAKAESEAKEQQAQEESAQSTASTEEAKTHPSLCTLGSAVVDYRGLRVAAQTVLPGILERPQEEQLKHGTTDFGRTVSAQPEYSKELEATAAALHIKPHKVVDEKTGNVVELHSSIECKGITGNDRRLYALDILRSTPVDLNFVPLQIRHRHHKKPTAASSFSSSSSSPEKASNGENKEDEEEVIAFEVEPSGETHGEGSSGDGTGKEFDEAEIAACEECRVHDAIRVLCFPFSHPHRVAHLRPELVEAYIEYKYTLYLRLLTLYLHEAGLIDKNKGAKPENGDSNKSTSETASSTEKSKDTGVETASTLSASALGSTPVKPNLTKASELERIVRQNLYGTAHPEKDPDQKGEKHEKGAGTEKGPGLQMEQAVEMDLELAKAAANGLAGLGSLDVEKKESSSDKASNGEGEEKSKVQTMDPEARANLEREINKKCLDLVGSDPTTNNTFSIRLNPDVYLPLIKHKGRWSDLKRERLQVRECSEFLLAYQIPIFIASIAEHTTVPYDGSTFIDAMHAYGLNCRYLGLVAQLLTHEARYAYVFEIALTELLVRCVKRVWREWMSRIEWLNSAHAAAHFLNCLLSPASWTPGPIVPPSEEIQPQKTSKKRGGKRAEAESASGAQGDSAISASGDVPPPVPVNQPDPLEWTKETPRTFWARVVKHVKQYFHCNLLDDDATLDSIQESVCPMLSRMILLRAVCNTCGIQLALKDYSLDAPSLATSSSLSSSGGSKKTAGVLFSPEDILNFLPIISHMPLKQCPDAVQLFAFGQAHIENGEIQEGYELLLEAHNLLLAVHGPLHADLAACCRLLARLAYVLNDHAEAFNHQLRATIISERVFGIDKPNTATEYANLALYSFANEQCVHALKFLYRARYIALLNHTEIHPEIAVIDGNIGLILYAMNEFEYAIKYLEHAISLHKKCYGSTKTPRLALLYHLLARASSCLGDFRTALLEEKETYNIYKSLLGENNERTQASYECMRYLAQQAVLLQKRVKEMTMKSTGLSESAAAAAVAAAQLAAPPIIVQAPTFASLRETMNLLNGIVLTPEEMVRSLGLFEAVQSYMAAAAAAAGGEGGAPNKAQSVSSTNSKSGALKGADSNSSSALPDENSRQVDLD